MINSGQATMNHMTHLIGNHPQLRIWIIGMLLFPVVFFTACAPVTEDLDEDFHVSATNIDSEPTVPMPVIPTPSRKDLQKTPKIPERVQITPGAETQPITGESPADLLEAVKADLQERSGVLMDEIVVFRDQSVTWNDGSLGCPRPGMVYTQALVDGYWIVLKVGEREYDYRASSSGYFFLCEGGVLPGLQTPEIPPIPGQPPDL